MNKIEATRTIIREFCADDAELLWKYSQEELAKRNFQMK